MKVTIITVTFNSAATLEQTILSVSGQSYPHIEYIVVDGKSTEYTRSSAKKTRGSMTR
jgi:glycosyltransferase involved in cell wall biosynthesis